MSNFKFSLVDPDKKTQVPCFQEISTRNDNTFVAYGPNNDFPNQLIQAINSSPTASSIVNGTLEIIKSYDISSEITLLNYPNVNSEGDTVHDLVYALCKDYIMFGAYAVQIIYNKKHDIAELYHIPFEYIRMNESKTKIWFNKKWTKYASSKIVYNNFDKSSNEGSQIYAFTNNGRRSTYGLSPFTSVLNDIVSEDISSKFIKTSLDSGLSARYVISLPNAQNLTDEDKQEIEDGIRDKFTGIENAGQFMLYFNSGTDGLEVSKIDSDNSHELFNSIRETASLSIYKSMHATPALFGDPSHSTGFNQNEYDESFSLYENMTIKPICRTVERSFSSIFDNEVLKINV